MEFCYSYSSSLGALTLSSNGRSIPGLWIEGQKYYMAALEDAALEKDLSIFRQA